MYLYLNSDKALTISFMFVHLNGAGIHFLVVTNLPSSKNILFLSFVAGVSLLHLYDRQRAKYSKVWVHFTKLSSTESSSKL